MLWPNACPYGRPLALSAQPGGSELVPGLGVLEPELLEPVLAVGDGPRDDELRHADPVPARHRVDLGVVVPAALPPPDLLGHVRDVRQGGLVEERVVVRDDDDVRAGLRLDGRGHARLDVVLVDPLHLHLHARLLAELRGLLLEEGVRGLDEVRPLEEVEPGAPGRGRRLGVGENAREPARDGRARRRGRAAQPAAPGHPPRTGRPSAIVARHGWLPPCRGVEWLVGAPPRGVAAPRVSGFILRQAAPAGKAGARSGGEGGGTTAWSAGAALRPPGDRPGPCRSAAPAPAARRDGGRQWPRACHPCARPPPAASRSRARRWRRSA